MKIYWLDQNESAVPPGDGWLGEREMETLAQLRIPKRRADWRLGRWNGDNRSSRHRLPRHEGALAAIQIIAP